MALLALSIDSDTSFFAITALTLSIPLLSSSTEGTGNPIPMKIRETLTLILATEILIIPTLPLLEAVSTNLDLIIRAPIHHFETLIEEIDIALLAQHYFLTLSVHLLEAGQALTAVIYQYFIGLAAFHLVAESIQHCESSPALADLHVSVVLCILGAEHALRAEQCILILCEYFVPTCLLAPFQ